MSADSNTLGDRIAKVCLEQYEKLGKNGKPDGAARQWTMVAGVVAERSDGSLAVLTLATGSKCLGACDVSLAGDTVNDSHAEVLAIRALRLLMTDRLVAARPNDDLVECAPTRRLRRDVRLHLYCSHAPCGDACIFPLDHRDAADAAQEDVGDVLAVRPLLDESLKKRAREEDEEEAEGDGRGKRVCDIHRTGGRSEADDLAAGVDYHVTGVVRTKPGRGPPTESKTCSDKIARWTVMGVQGALLSRSLEAPVYLTSVTVGQWYHEEALHRALCTRICLSSPLPAPYKHSPPVLYSTRHRYAHGRELPTTSALSAPLAVVWHCDWPPNKAEVLARGVRAGVTAKARKKNALAGVSRVSARHLWMRWGALEGHTDAPHDDAGMPLLLAQAKRDAVLFQRARTVFHANEPFSKWKK